METIFNFLQDSWYWILIVIAALIILLKFFPRYKIAPPDTALIISGLIRRNYKVRNSDGTVASKCLQEIRLPDHTRRRHILRSRH